MKKVFDLPCLDSRKSFYGKAKIIEEDGNKILLSYNTPVASIDRNGHFTRLWGGESATTIRHLNSFLAFYGLQGGGVKWWRAQNV